jgi:oligoendopeptidase F
MSKENKKELPSWDLSDIYPSMDSPEFEKDMKSAAVKAERFEKRYKDNLEGLSGEEFGKAISEFEEISTLMNKTGVYAFLMKATKQTDTEIKAFESKTDDRHNDISRKTLFFNLEINKLSDENLADKLKAPEAKKYAPWLDGVRAEKDYQLSDEVEKVLHEKSQTGSSTWVKYYAELKARMRFEIDGEELTEPELASRYSSHDDKEREKAGKEYGRVTEDYNWQLATVVNNVAKDKQISDDLRGFKSPVSSRNLANQVEDEVVDSLVNTVKDNYESTSHRYYAMKAEMLGKENLEYWDRNAPLKGVESREYSWEEAKDIVYNAYKEFDPEIAKIGKKFFDNNWIDVAPKAGKRAGAFACPTVKDCHPYLMLNFTGKARDVMTLAHELGHGVHQYLAKEQGQLMENTPLTLAETASVFGEMMTFKYMLKHETDPKKRLGLLAGKAEDMLNTSVRQIAFHDYEVGVHTARKEGELKVDDLNNIWTKSMKDSLGPKVNIAPEAQNIWGQIPHCIRTPFYVYAYAFGDNLVNSLYKTYEDGKVEDFQGKYKEMLSKGGTQKHKELLKPMGLDASKPDFWQKGMDVLKGIIDDVEKTAKDLGMLKDKKQQKGKVNAAVAMKKVAKAR